MAWTVSNPVSIGLATKKSHYDALWDNCDFFKVEHATDGTHAAVTATSVASASITPSNLTASLPVFSDGAKKLVSNTMTGTGKVVMDTSPTLVTPTLGAASGTSLTLSGLTASLPVFTDGSKALVSKSVADTLTALGVGSAAFQAYVTNTMDNVTGDGTTYNLNTAIWTEVFDTGSCVADGVFTAPATGIYLFTGNMTTSDLDASHSVVITLVTTSASFVLYLGAGYGGIVRAPFAMLCPLTAADTAYLRLYGAGSTKTIDLGGGDVTYTSFACYRLK